MFTTLRYLRIGNVLSASFLDSLSKFGTHQVSICRFLCYYWRDDWRLAFRTLSECPTNEDVL